MSAEPSNPSGLPGRSRPALSDLSRETTEDDLWNLDQEPVVPRVPPPRDAPKTPHPHKDPADGTGKKEAQAPSELPVLSAEPKLPLTRPAQLDEIGDLDEVEDIFSDREGEGDQRPAPEEPPSPAAGESPPRPRAAAATPAPRMSLRPRLDRREVIGIASFAVVALVALIWVILRSSSQFSFTRASDAYPDYPLEGQFATVESADTFWREPVRSGENPDTARREVVMIPILELHLDPGKSTSGVVRIVFRNGEGEPVGDTITRSFNAGRFDATGSPTFPFAATDGFINEAHFQAYRAGKGDFWTADVLEAPSGSAPSDSFKKLSSIPLQPTLR